MSLQDPTKKMSKSDPNPNGYISLLDPKDIIIKKFKKAVTNSENIVRYSETQPGVQNLINIYACVTNKTPQEIEKEFDGIGYGMFKTAVGEAVADTLAEIQSKYEELNSSESDEILKKIYAHGAENAQKLATPKLHQVYEAVGFITK